MEQQKSNIVLFETAFGSKVYGTDTETSDTDIGMVILDSEDSIFGISGVKTFEQKIENGEDTRRYTLKRFTQLCVNGNPNVIEWLFTPMRLCNARESFIKHILLDPKQLLSREALISSHLGFAKSQHMKIANHEKTMGAKRKELREKFGYDTKYASHCIRLLLQLRSLLKYCYIVFPYKENVAQVLKDIKAGAYTLEQYNELYEFELAQTQVVIEQTEDAWKHVPSTDLITPKLKAIFMEEYGYTST